MWTGWEQLVGWADGANYVDVLARWNLQIPPPVAVPIVAGAVVEVAAGLRVLGVRLDWAPVPVRETCGWRRRANRWGRRHRINDGTVDEAQRVSQGHVPGHAESAPLETAVGWALAAMPGNLRSIHIVRTPSLRIPSLPPSSLLPPSTAVFPQAKHQGVAASQTRRGTSTSSRRGRGRPATSHRH